ncbi:vWA domain-containing protein [Xinfangfangia pollutisoli]|uniref:vWA domain-containing protein n=1 Tax=Xinfangfangia pollutisoli TaxID=2865960 RepID=UPI001CD3B92D|nr:VWA domain-containing protein [Xinfangfangia pollutisoli]
MTDELDALKAALKGAPAPDPQARARALALAMENYDRLQASGAAPRPKEDRPRKAAFQGVRSMLNFLTSRPALAATTSVAALIVGVTVLLPVAERLTPPLMPKISAPGTPQGPGSSLAEAAPPAADPAPGGAADAPAAAARIAPPAPEAPPAAAEEAARLAEPKPEAQAVAEAEADAAMADSDARARKSAAAPGSGIVEAPEMYALPAPVTLPDILPSLEPDTEAYATAEANPVKVTAEEPVSTFSTDIDTASYALVRSTLNMGVLPTPDQVRVEEMVNYFPYAYPAPEGGQPFATTVSVMPTPWNAGTELVTIGLQGALPAMADRPALNLVFLIDTSGSMEDPKKLGLLKQSLALMLPELRPEDQIAIVAYAGSAGLVLEPTKAAERDRILAALDGLTAGGSTAGAEGLELAYQTAKAMQGEGEVSRILLATDGDFNVGVSDPEGLTAYVAKKRQQDGTYLSVLGFGRGNLDDATMQALAQNGNGQAAYIDTLSEARKVLVDQLTGALFSIADDVKVQVEWNPAQVAEYRLIGYETRALQREDFNNDKVDAGEIGAGLQVTAIYEITPVGSEALRNDPLRYGTAPEAKGGSDELGFLRLRWKAPGAASSQLIERPITGQEAATDDSRFAAAIAGFGQLLQGSVYLGDWSWDQAISLALSARGDDPYGYRIEAVSLMRLAQSLAK